MQHAAAPHASLWSWLGERDAASEEAQLAWKALLSEAGIDLSLWGCANAKAIGHLWEEVQARTSLLKRTASGELRRHESPAAMPRRRWCAARVARGVVARAGAPLASGS